ncbi:MAG TPA: OsmC family protein [Candidatus Dormibacteraeota bacterium]|nr:OsmC family protein [Candidatus Dormibacteraeota bacterium]
MEREHFYNVTVTWTGNLGTGTSSYQAYERSHEILVSGKPPIPGSSDAAFRGDPSRYNPEDLLVASLSACHMLWYLHLCADAGIAVTRYVDRAEGEMVESPGGGGRFRRVELRPEVTIADAAREAEAQALHHAAHEKCFVANSVNFPVECDATITVE